MKELSLLAREQDRPKKIPTVDLLESGELAQYLEDRPESARRIQEEIKEMSLLSPKSNAKTLEEQNEEIEVLKATVSDTETSLKENKKALKAEVAKRADFEGPRLLPEHL